MVKSSGHTKRLERIGAGVQRPPNQAICNSISASPSSQRTAATAAAASESAAAPSCSTTATGAAISAPAGPESAAPLPSMIAPCAPHPARNAKRYNALIRRLDVMTGAPRCRVRATAGQPLGQRRNANRDRSFGRRARCDAKMGQRGIMQWSIVPRCGPGKRPCCAAHWPAQRTGQTGSGHCVARAAPLRPAPSSGWHVGFGAILFDRQ